jgi:hypothetical protein
MVLITRWLRLLVHHSLHAASKLLRPLLRLLRLRYSIGTVCASVRILRCVLYIAVSMMQHLVLILLALEQPHNSSCIAVVLSPKHNTLRLPRWRWTSLLSDQHLACLLTKHCTVSIPQSSLEPVYNRDPFYQDLCLLCPAVWTIRVQAEIYAYISSGLHLMSSRLPGDTVLADTLCNLPYRRFRSQPTRFPL